MAAGFRLRTARLEPDLVSEVRNAARLTVSAGPLPKTIDAGSPRSLSHRKTAVVCFPLCPCRDFSMNDSTECEEGATVKRAKKDARTSAVRKTIWLRPTRQLEASNT